MAEVKEIKETEKDGKSLVSESKSTHTRDVVTRDTMIQMDEISEDIFEVFRKYDLSIWEAKNIIPYLVAKISEEARDNEMDIVEYIDLYLKPSALDFSKGLRNFRKFSEKKFHKVESVRQ
ncbi:hypothetical protein [Cuniculiplasma divulgatum]|jgi:hypothetical protein|uniref:Uncharacterized protein n=1 Tax=Cuniculiplasma divulgatum TaxID=1673428 RepID=A0A1N5S9H8_9ARCH|nr:hypothetical protein [Cuniculiplasma divulgatum]EQB69354.1 MAG: hypothetical protein AMDU5_GPLC00004G0324 [Thermoplasmatales archaeon Gpl]MCI2413465.1 hypothetical protein [Cuniculiplasma sp.]MCL4320111.1 hypothetical protein [Candidatus Thermoplasmatota archaeon]OWP55081.1 MAG: hypothetical protein B2I18_07810 [Cuniculiplasma sp. C_DKE]WMT50241.1 MAG: hypothetical protein RE472_04535 [Thermoplasmatales archaeon]